VRYWTSFKDDSEDIYHGSSTDLLADYDWVNGVIAKIEDENLRAQIQQYWQKYQQWQVLNTQKEVIEWQLLNVLSNRLTQNQPTQVLASFSPDIGIPNEPKYRPMREDDGWY
jgi:hypothetical protein